MPKDTKVRKRMVVEEVSPEITPEAASTSEPVEEIKEKVEELQDITEGMGQAVEKSSEVQEEIVQAAEKVEPVVPQPEMKPAIPVGSGYNKGPNIWIILIPGVLLLGALLGGIFFYEKGINSQSQATPTPLATSETLVTPSASPFAKLDLTKFPINVENGSGIPGTASSAKDLVTKAGFTVSATGNAATYDYTDTIIETKSDVPQAFIDKLTTTLGGIYKVGTPKALSSGTDEVVVIVGSSKSQ